MKIKIGKYVPGLILHPEEGIDASIYAKHKAVDYSFKDSGPLKGALDMTSSIVDAAMTIEEQYNAITKAFGHPKEAEPKPEEPELDPRDPKSLFKSLNPTVSQPVIKSSVDRLSKPTKKAAPIKKNKPAGADLLLDFEQPSSGYVTNETGNSEASSTPANNGSTDLLGMDESFFKDKTDSRLFDDAMAGQNLLAMVEEPKQRFNDVRSDLLKGASGKGTGVGSAMMDFFVDPTQLFASERHPALQEVLKVLSKSKHFRGSLTCFNFRHCFRQSFVIHGSFKNSLENL